MDEYFTNVSLLIPGESYSASAVGGFQRIFNDHGFHKGPFKVPYRNLGQPTPTTPGSYLYYADTQTKDYISSIAIQHSTDASYRFVNTNSTQYEDTLFYWDGEDFTIEGWFQWSSASNQGIFQTGGFSTSIHRIGIYRTSSDTVILAIYDDSGNSATISDSLTASSINSGWHHIAVSRDDSANNIYFFIDGVHIGTKNYTFSGTMTDGIIMFGARNSAGTLTNAFGYAQDIRVTKGVCRYTDTVLPTGASLLGSISGTVYAENGDPEPNVIVSAIPQIGANFTTSGLITTGEAASTYSVVTPTKFVNILCAVTDVNGEYSIRLPKAEWTLLFMKPNGTPLLNNIVHRVIAE